MNIRKCAIIGCGNVGATTAYTLMQSGLFSEMVLIDIDMKRAQGEAEDIAHGLPFHSPMNIYAGSYSDLSDARSEYDAAYSRDYTDYANQLSYWQQKAAEENDLYLQQQAAAAKSAAGGGGSGSSGGEKKTGSGKTRSEIIQMAARRAPAKTIAKEVEKALEAGTITEADADFIMKGYGY